MLDALDAWYFAIGFKFVYAIVGIGFLTVIWLLGYSQGRKDEARHVF